MELAKYVEKLKRLSGSIIAVVYTFIEDVNDKRYYDAWKADVLSDWVRGIYDINCTPLVMDLETFAFKAFNNTLPKIDFVINLNNGASNLSALGLLPSICSYLNLPCIPNNSENLIIGENKLICNSLAKNAGIQIPKYIDDESKIGITRPLNLGSSKGVHRGNQKKNSRDICQEFIPGFDMTITFLYNPIVEQLDFVSALMYLPHTRNINWYLGETEKEKRDSYSKIAAKIENSYIKKLKEFIKEYFAISTLCRIDTRVKCKDETELLYFTKHPVNSNRIYFLEINTLPTIKEHVNFTDTILNTIKPNDFRICLNEFQKFTNSNKVTGFILSCILLSNI